MYTLYTLNNQFFFHCSSEKDDVLWIARGPQTSQEISLFFFVPIKNGMNQKAMGVT